MKQLLRKSLALATMFTALVSYSNNLTLKANEKTNNITMVSFEDVKGGSLLLMKDSDDLILYRELIEKSGAYSKAFDLTNLPDADYYFELDTQEEIKIIPFIVNANIAEFVKDGEYKIVKPIVIVRDDFVYISKKSTDKQSCEIDIYYEGYDLAYSEKLKNMQHFNKVYDFSTSKRGNYTIVFRIEGREIRNSIQI